MNLLQSSCKPAIKDGMPLSTEAASALLQQLNGWQLNPDNRSIHNEYKFRNYYQTIAFVNAIAWLSHQEDHHPDLEVSYNRCLVRYSTHSVGGLSENDFICAAKADALFSADYPGNTVN